MRATWKRSLVLPAFLLLFTTAFLETLGQSLSVIPDDVKASMLARVESGLNMGIVLGAVSASGTEFYSVGYVSAARSAEVDETTVFEIGSVGKTFTGILLADAVGRGDVRLEDPIQQYLPKTVTVPTRFGREITLLHLTTHTSGLPAIPDNLAPADEMNPYADYTVALLYEFLSAYRLPSLGTRYLYSNAGFGLLGHILELRTGTNYEELLATRLTSLLGMTSTVMTPTAEIANRLATGYRGGEAFPRWDNPTLAGAGGGVSTATDLAIYVAANLGLRETSLAESLAASHKSHFEAGELRLGLGWNLRWSPGGTIVEHHGATGGAWAYVGFIKERQVGVVVLTNTYEDIDDLGRHILDPSYSLRIQGSS
ncbi:MAG: serine hydrolase [Candidatus Bipolaricaulis sp.]|nr:serine hydrolase [Candidatus Bipolaricaulis sp.]